MIKALVIKELRESAGVLVVAAIVATFVVTSLAGLPLLPIPLIAPDSFPFVSGSFLVFLGIVVGVTGVALGLKQTAWESAHNTYHFLLHRPVSREFIFGTKLAVGLTATLLLGAIMILVYATWAARPGDIATPFFWSMTLPAWQLLASLSLVYLGAFLSGIRPARWFGSRLGPLLAGGMLVAALAVCWPFWWLTLALVALLAAIALAAIFQYVDGRDY